MTKDKVLLFLVDIIYLFVLVLAKESGSVTVETIINLHHVGNSTWAAVTLTRCRSCRMHPLPSLLTHHWRCSVTNVLNSSTRRNFANAMFSSSFEPIKSNTNQCLVHFHINFKVVLQVSQQIPKILDTFGFRKIIKSYKMF